MAMAKKRRRLPTSGDRLIDWHFRELVHILERGVKAIRKKKGLVAVDDKPPRKAVRGLYDHDLEMIFLNAAKSVHPTWQDFVETLVHEAYHKIYDHKHCKHAAYVRHKSQNTLAGILMKKFSDEQKQFLRKFIPKKEVRHDPPPCGPTTTLEIADQGNATPPESLPEFDADAEK